MHAFTYGASHVAARIALTKSTRVGSHMRGNVYDNMSKTAHVNSHMRALLLPYIHSHVNSGRTCGFHERPWPPPRFKSWGRNIVARVSVGQWVNGLIGS